MLSVGIVSNRPDRRDRICDRLREIGFDQEILVEENLPDEPPSTLAHAQAALRLMQRVDVERSHMLLIEDDVDFDDNLISHVYRAMEMNVVVTLYLPGTKFYQSGVLDAIKRERRNGRETSAYIAPIANLQEWYGSQCLLLPRWIMDDVLELSREKISSFDIMVRTCLRRKNRRLYACVPNLVQHMNAPSQRRGRRYFHVSSTYDLRPRQK